MESNVIGGKQVAAKKGSKQKCSKSKNPCDAKLYCDPATHRCRKPKTRGRPKKVGRPAK